MKPCISQATTMPCAFAEDVANFADAGCPALEVWLTKLEQHLERHSAADTKKLLHDRAMTLAAAAYQGGLLLSQGEARAAHYEHFRKRLELCQYFEIKTLLVAADFAEPIDPTTLSRALVSLTQAAQWAAAYDVTLAAWNFAARTRFAPVSIPRSPWSSNAANRTSASILTFFITTPARASLRISRTFRLIGSRMCRLPTSPAYPASCRPTATASCPATATSTWRRFSPGCAKSATRAGCRWN